MGDFVLGGKTSVDMVLLVRQCDLVDLCVCSFQEMGRGNTIFDHWKSAGYCISGLYYLPEYKENDPHSCLGVGIIDGCFAVLCMVAGSKPHTTVYGSR